jgi:Delta3-Delta2-enoyl-CoA isomerase
VRELWQPDEKRLRELWRLVQDCWIKLYSSPYPNVAAINGLNSAGACFFTMSCEYRVMVPKSKIGLSGARLGIAIPLPLILTMKNIIGAREADLAITSGKLYSSEDALKIGLIDEIAADKADALLQSERFLNRFKKIPPVARGKTKLLMRRKEIDEIMNNREHDIDEFVKAILSSEAQREFELFLKQGV